MYFNIIIKPCVKKDYILIFVIFFLQTSKKISFDVLKQKTRILSHTKVTTIYRNPEKRKEDLPMNEIPKNPQTPIVSQQSQAQVQKAEQVKTDATSDVQQPVQQEVQKKEINEIPDNPMDRSTVKVDNLENDIKVFAANPELAKRALDVAELAEKKYAEAGIEQPELKALAVGKAFVEEFQK